MKRYNAEKTRFKLIEHWLVGNTEDNSGVKDIDEIKEELTVKVEKTVERIEAQKGTWYREQKIEELTIEKKKTVVKTATGKVTYSSRRISR